MVWISVLFCIVFDHLTTTLAPWSVRITSPLVNCLDGSKVEMECGSILEMRKNVKKPGNKVL